MEKRRDTEFNFFFPLIKEVIIDYARIDYVHCREILLSFIDFDNEIIRNELLDIWKKTTIGYEEEKKKVYPFIDNTLDRYKIKPPQQIRKEKE